MDKGYVEANNLDLYENDRAKINTELEESNVDDKFEAAYQEMFGTSSSGEPTDAALQEPKETAPETSQPEPKETAPKERNPSLGFGLMAGGKAFDAPGHEAKPDGVFGNLFDFGSATLTRALDTLGAPADFISAGPARPSEDPGIFGPNFDGGQLLNQIGHTAKDVKVGTQAFLNAFLGNRDPEQTGRAMDNLGVPESYRAAVTTLMDPLVFAGLPTAKLLQSTLRKSVEQGVDVTQGLFGAMVGEFVGAGSNASLSVDSIKNAIQTKQFESLAKRADAGDKTAAKKLIEKIDKSEIAQQKAVDINDFDMAEEAARIKGVLGDPSAKAFKMDKLSPEDLSELVYKSLTDSTVYRRVDINYSKFEGGADTMVTMKNLVNKYSQDFSESIKTVSNADTIEASQRMQLSDLIGKPVTNLSPKRAYGLRQLMLDSARSVNVLARKAGATGAELDLLATERAVAFHRLIQAEAVGVASNAGRTLQALAIPVTGDAKLLKFIADATKNSTKNPRRDINKLISTLNSNPFADMSALSRFLNKNTLARIDDAIFENYANSILSGAAQVVNMGNNALISMWQVPQQSIVAMTASGRALANAPGAMISGKENKALQEANLEIQKVKATASGIAQGVKDTLVLAYKSNTRTKALKDIGIEKPKKPPQNAPAEVQEAFIEQMAVFEAAEKQLRSQQWGDLGIHTKMRESHELQAQRYQPSISSGDLGTTGPFGAFVDYAGRAIRVPGNLLLEADKGFKLINYRAAINKQAVEAAHKAAPDASGAAKRRAYLEYVNNPPSSDMVDSALDVADYLTFTNSLGQTGKNFQRAFATPGLRYIVPFFRTPTNIVKMGLRHSTVGHLFSGDLKAALLRNDPKGDAARARVATGTMAPLALVMNIDDDRITGHIDKNTTEGKLLLARGIEPYNMVVTDPITGKDRIFDYSKIEPLRTILGMAVNYKKSIQNIKQVDIKGNPTEASKELFVAFVAPFIHAVGDNYLLPQIGAVAEAMDSVLAGNSTQLERLMTNFATSNVPFSSLQRDVNTAFIDNNFRQADSFITSFMRNIPVLSSEVPGLYTTWGDEVLHDPVVHEDIRNPLYTKSLGLDEYDQIITDSEASVPRRRSKIPVPDTNLPGGISLELSAKQTARHSVLMGKGIDIETGEQVFPVSLKETFIELIDSPATERSPAFRDLPRLIQQQEFNRRFTQATEQADAYLLATDTELQSQKDTKIEARLDELKIGN